jgi:predicted dehydrogenase
MEPAIGVIGCGNISRFHFQGLKKTGAHVVHIADMNEKAAEPYVKETGARFSKDYHDVLRDGEVDTVFVLTNAKTHLPFCTEALKAGKNVVCEKTMTNNEKEARELVRAVESSGKIFFTAFMKRFFSAAKKAKELIPSLGHILGAQVRAYQNWGIDVYGMKDISPYLSILDSYGGAVLKCAGSHMLDMTAFLLGKPSGLSAYVDFFPDTNFDRKATVLFDYPGGAAVQFETAIHTLTKVGYERNSWDEWIKIEGTEGRLALYTVMWDHPENNGPLLLHYDNRTESRTEFRFSAENPFDAEVAYIMECLRNGRQGKPDVNDGFLVDCMIDSIFMSAREKRRVSLPN